jgi:hypothetical protein
MELSSPSRQKYPIEPPYYQIFLPNQIIMSDFHDTPPTHHIHDDSTILPGAAGGDRSYDYSADTVNSAPSSAFDDDQGEAFERTAEKPVNDPNANEGI